MTGELPSSTYHEQLEQAEASLRRVSGLTHDEYIAALTLLVIGQVREAEELLDYYQVDIPESRRRITSL